MVYFCIAFFIGVVAIIKLLMYRKYLRRSTLYVSGTKRRKYEYIYVFRGGREAFWRVKIGRTNNLLSRLRSHRTANPFGIVVLMAFKTSDSVEAERFLHDEFSYSRISTRNEWFTLNPRLLLSMVLLNDPTLVEQVSGRL